jgi:CBS domain-containing protein
MSATVRDVMTTHVVAVRRNASVKEMAARLREYRVSAFPVVDDDNIVIGVVSGGDLLTKEALAPEGSGPVGPLAGLLHRKLEKKARGSTAADLMTSPAWKVGPDASVGRAARLMHDHKVKRLPVVDGGGHLIGIVSRVDVLSVYSRPDSDIRRDVIAMISDKFLMDPDPFTVIVKDGVVTLGGHPETATLGQMAVDGAWHMEGVVAVRDRLAYPATASPTRRRPDRPPAVSRVPPGRELPATGRCGDR